MMTLPHEWYPAINVRRSRRRYDKSRPIEPGRVERLHKACAEFRPFPSARVEFVAEPPDDIFTNALVFYGNIKFAPSFLAFIGDMSDRNVQEKMGYTSEGIILEATALGLGTCWVALTFRSKSALAMLKLDKGEKLIGVSPVGYATDVLTFEERAFTGFGANHQRKPFSTMVSGMPEPEWPAWARAAVEAARLAPSAINRQPWNFHIEKNSLTVAVKSPGMEFNVSKRLDCGIAMLHVGLGALSCGRQGKWELLKQPQVGRFLVE
jgi:hypothetical protein